MDRRKFYRQDGYQKGFEDAKRTGGNVRQEYIDNCLNTEQETYQLRFQGNS